MSSVRRLGEEEKPSLFFPASRELELQNSSKSLATFERPAESAVPSRDPPSKSKAINVIELSTILRRRASALFALEGNRSLPPNPVILCGQTFCQGQSAVRAV